MRYHVSAGFPLGLLALGDFARQKKKKWPWNSEHSLLFGFFNRGLNILCIHQLFISDSLQPSLKVFDNLDVILFLALKITILLSKNDLRQKKLRGKNCYFAHQKVIFRPN